MTTNDVFNSLYRNEYYHLIVRRRVVHRQHAKSLGEGG